MYAYGSEAAYEAGKARAIARNRAKGIASRRPAKREAFLAVEGNAELVERMKAAAESGDAFMEKLLYGYDEYGSLTDKQVAAARKSLERTRVWEQSANARARREGADSRWFLEKGERGEFEAEILRVKELDARSFSYHGSYENRWMFTLRTTDGNIVVYFGTSNLGEAGDSIKLRATAKKLDVYRGVKQTVVSRPHLVEGAAS